MQPISFIYFYITFLDDMFRESLIPETCHKFSKLFNFFCYTLYFIHS
jgi:hypothetical protein